MPENVVKMSTLARLSGVPAATIKHYIREGLLPEPKERPYRNVALYDPALAHRIRQIKKLQREHFLPLRVIKSVLDGRPSANDDTAAAAAIERTLEAMASHEMRTRREIVASGACEEDLRLFESLGLIAPRTIDGEETFTGDDLAFLRILAASRRAGITRDMLPPDIIGPYVVAIRELARVELDMFRRGIVPRAGADLAQVTEAATRLSEQLVVLIRRKLLLPTLAQLVDEAQTKRASAPRKRSSRTVHAQRRTRR